MKVIEILNFNRELLKRLQAAGIRLEDARYIDLYEKASGGRHPSGRCPVYRPVRGLYPPTRSR